MNRIYRSLIMIMSLTGYSLICYSQINASPKLGNKIFSTAGFYAVPSSDRTVNNFNPGWRFYKGDVKGAHQINFDDSQWQAANLPHGVELLSQNGSGGRNYQGKAWYRKSFSLPENSKTKKSVIYFEAVMGYAKVWVNGKVVAEHFGGYLPFAVDVSDITHHNKLNVIAVLADNSDNKLYPPGKNQAGLDFTYFGGIYRDTFLIQTNSVHITLRELSDTVAGGGIFAATLDVTDKNADMVVKSEVINESGEHKQLTIKTVLEDSNHKTLQTLTEKITLKGGEKKQLTKKFTANNIRFWHPDDPYLHFIRTDVVADGKVVDSLRTRVGIRLFEMRGADGLFINKKWIGKKLLGVNRHQDYTYVGNAVPNSGHWRDVKLLREGGSNIIRAGHYPMDPAFYDACDELGMLTTTANPGWHFFNFKENIFEQRLYEDTRNLVRRDRNVASILMWETALNETPQQPGHVMNNMHQVAHKEYPFSGMYTVTDFHEAKKGGLDIYYHGSDESINSFNREYGDGYEVDNWKSQNAETRVPLAWGEKALLNQALVEAEYLNDRYPTPKVRLGGAMWAGIDHQRGYHPDPFWGGQLSGLRLPKYTYHVYKSQYDANYKLKGIKTGPMLFIAHELTQISPEDVVIFSNVDEVKLTIFDKVYGPIKPSTDEKYADLPHPPFIFKNVYSFDTVRIDYRKKTKEVKLIAEGYINKKRVVTQVKDYAERTAAVQLSLDYQGVPLIADGSDFVPVRATIVDQEGTEKVLASANVFFYVEGPAEVIGGIINKSNPASTEMGIATALIRSTIEAGEIKVTAYVDGLKSDTIVLESQPSQLNLLYDKMYENKSRNADHNNVVITNTVESYIPPEIKALQQEIKTLKLSIIDKDQDIMNLRSTQGQKNH